MQPDSIYCGDSIEVLRLWQNDCVDCCVTSPPYYGLRDYGAEGQIGLESTPEEYINRLTVVFREVRRVLKPSGSLWVIIGDSYAGSGKGAWKNKSVQKEVYIPNPDGPEARMPNKWTGIKPKDLIGIPWMLAFALRADGWYLRQELIWSKPNGMPESVRDRCGKSHENIFLLSKSPRYYFDADSIKQPAKKSSLQRLHQNVEQQAGSARTTKNNGRMKAVIGGYRRPNDQTTTLVNKRSVWQVPTASFKGAHFAVYPEKLIVDCIKAGCPEGGIVLDPFMGAGTTALVAEKLNRHFVGCEIHRANVSLAFERLDKFRTTKLNTSISRVED